MNGDAGDSRDAEAVFAEWLARVEAGEPLDFEHLSRAHAELEVDLRQLHDDWRTFAPVLGKVVPGMMSSIQGDGVPLDADAPGDEPAADELLAKFGVRTPHGDRYRFRRVIGQGGGGVVLKVWDTKLRRPLAMKIVLGRDETRPSGDTPKVDRGMLARFVDEARIASQLNHPGIVPVHEIGADDTGRAFFTMKLVKGDDLSVIFERVRTGEDGWTEVRALDTLMRVCETIAYAHSKGVIHRDLKPANVMVGPFGEVHVMDWGLARVAGEPDRRDLRIREASVVDSLRKTERDATPRSPIVTVDGTTIGTPCYMPPEQAKGQLELIGPHSDVYSVGAMLYELIAGERPYVPRDARVPMAVVLENVMHGPPRDLLELAPRAPAELIAICEQAMAREIKDRYASMSALADDLRAFINGHVVSAYETGTWAETKKWVKRNRGLASSLAAMVVVLVTGLTATLVFKAQSDENARETEENTYYAAVIGAQAARRSHEFTNVRRLLDSAPERLRNWEWRYLDAASDASLLKLDHHGSTAACFSPDGTRIVTASWNDHARVWDARLGEALTTLDGPTGHALSFSFSPDGRHIVTTAWDSNVAYVFDASSGKKVASLDGHTDEVHSASFSTDGTRIVTASADNTVRVWDALSGEVIETLVHASGVSSVAVSPDGRSIVTTSPDYILRVWDALSGEVLKTLLHTSESTGHEWSASFSHDGSWIVVATPHDGLRVWDPWLGNALVTLKQDIFEWIETYSVSFSPDDSQIVAACSDHTARVWYAATMEGELSQRLVGHTDEVREASFSPDGTRITTASADNTARVWNPGSGEEIAKLEGHTNEVLSASFSSDGTRILTTSVDHTARVWDALFSNALITREHLSGYPTSALFSPDGTRIIAVPSCQNLGGLGARGSAQVHDALTGRTLSELGEHTGCVNGAAFSPDGARIVTASSDTLARVWDSTSGRLLMKLEGHRGEVQSAAFSPDGAFIVTASSDKAACVWDALTGEKLATLEGHTEGVNSASFSPDGTRIVTASRYETVRVWDAASGRELRKLERDGWSPHCAVFAPDGSRIFTGSNEGAVHVWDPRSDQPLVKLEGHTSAVQSVSFSPDGTRIVTASWDETVRVWDAASGRELAKLEGHMGLVTSAAFSHDGARILTAGGDTVRVWDTVPYRERYAERRALEAARPAGEKSLADALAHSMDFDDAGARLRNDVALEPLVRRAALDLLLERCNAARQKADGLERKRAERLWRSRLLGHEAWPSEQEVEQELATRADETVEPDDLNSRAWRIVNPEAPESGDEVLALVLARRAVALDPVPTHRTTLAYALKSLGRFDEATAEQRMALDEADRASRWLVQHYFDRLQTDIAALRDEFGQLRRAELTTKLEALDKEIAALEADPDVRMWLGGR